MRRLLLFFLVLVPLVIACAPAEPSGFDDPGSGTDAAARDAGDGVIVTAGDDEDAADPVGEIGDDDDASAIAPDPPSDAASIDPPDAAPPDGACTTPLAAGDLAIVELMIASVTGSGDHGEWIEIASARDCALDLHGLRGACAVGSKVPTFEVADHEWLAPRGRFLVADSANPTLDHDLPGLVLTWTKEPGDVLRNQGSTITLRTQDAIVDVLTYPPLKSPPGRAVAFPDDCASSARADWTKWQVAAASWFPSFFGTPNAPNVDVKCPLDAAWYR